METLSLSQELKKCIESMPDEIRAHFNYYCLGHRDNTICSNEYTLDQYIEKISKAIKERSNLGERFVVFKALNKSREIPKNRIPWKSDIKKMYHSNSYNKCMQYYNDIIEELSSCYISNGSKKIKYNINFLTLRSNTGVVFLIHPDVLSVNIEEIETFASIWNAYYFNNVDNFTNNTDFLFVIGNKNSIFTGYTPPTKEEIKENKLNLNMNMPIKSLVYEKI